MFKFWKGAITLSILGLCNFVCDEVGKNYELIIYVI
jgi:hypothetical protein